MTICSLFYLPFAFTFPSYAKTNNMKRRIQVVAILGMAIIAASCSKSNNETVPMSVQGTTPSKSVAMKTTGAKPFKGSMTMQPDGGSPLCSCAAGVPVVGTLSGSGNITHLGLTTTTIQPCVVPQANGFFVPTVCGSFFAANGDELITIAQPYTLFYAGSGASGDIEVDFAGGTGRFANATGSFKATLTIDLTTGVAVMSNIDGTVTY
jgi:hypothetical protein